jgi:murein DD-endopeptidase MepM/ murein hydrolase activator NlpD
MQKELKKTIESSENELENTEKEIKFIEQEIIRIKSRQVDTALFIRKTFTEKYKNSVQSKADSGIYSLMFGTSLGAMMAKNDTNIAIQDTIENLLGHQKSLQENLESLKKELDKKLLTKKYFNEQISKKHKDLKETQEVEQNSLATLNQKQENVDKKIAKVTLKKLEVQSKIIQKKTENTTQFETKFTEYERIIKESFAGYNCNTVKTAACIWMDKYLAMEKQLLSKGNNTQSFVWPLIPSNGFGNHFRDQKYFTTNEIHHEGLDIITPAGVPIQAIADGYILIKQNPGATSPGIIIIKHPNALLSVYIGINPNKKSMFTAVSAGDSIGTSLINEEHSGKNNVHIELYERGKAIDPLDKLDISSVKIEHIPARYGWKYIDDMKKINSPVNIEALQKTIGFFYVE